MEINKREKQLIIISFFIPILLIIFILFLLKISPFGSKTIWYIDLPAQMTYFYYYLLNVLEGKANLSYSFNYGLGQSFWETFSYYLSSPISLLVYIFKFFPKSYIIYCSLLIWLVKVGLSSSTFFYYLLKSFKISDNTKLLLSIMYAFNGFSIMYYFLPMWTDAVYLLPLGVLAIDRMVHKREKKMLIAVLVYSFLTNFYQSYIMGIFLFLYLLLKFFILNMKFVEIKKILTIFFQTVFLSFMCTLFITIPTYLSIKNNAYTQNSSSNFSGIFSLSPLDSYKMLFNSTTSQQNLTLYTTVFVVLIVPVYFSIKSISVREKVGMSFLMLLLFVSTTNNVLNLIWHIFQIPNGAPYRFVYLFSFCIIILVARIFEKWEEIDFRWITISFIANMIFLLFFSISDRLDILYFNIFLISSYYVLIYLFLKNEQRKSKLIHVFFILLILVDISKNTMFLFNNYSNSSIDDNYYQKDGEAFDNVMKFVKNRDNSYYRINIDPELGHSLNEGLTYPYKSLNIYSSTFDFEVSNYLNKFGYSAGPRFSQGNLNSIIFNNFLNEKYYITRNELPFSIYKKIYEVQGLKLYENKLNIDFGIDSKFIDGQKLFSTDWIENSNTFIKQKIFTDFSDSEMEIKSNINNEYLNEKNEKISSNIETTVNVINSKDNEIILDFREYSDVNPNLLNRIKIDINGKMVKFGNIDKKSHVLLLSIPNGFNEIRIFIPEEFYRHPPKVMKFDLSNLYDWTDKVNKSLHLINLKQNDLKNSITAEVSADTDTNVTLQIPYSRNWIVLIDGKEVSYKKNGIFLDFSLPSGNHKLEIKYLNIYLKYSLIISTSFIVIILAFYILRKNKITSI